MYVVITQLVLFMIASRPTLSCLNGDCCSWKCLTNQFYSFSYVTLQFLIQSVRVLFCCWLLVTKYVFKKNSLWKLFHFKYSFNINGEYWLIPIQITFSNNKPMRSLETNITGPSQWWAYQFTVEFDISNLKKETLSIQHSTPYL